MFVKFIEIFMLGLLGGLNPGPVLTSTFTVVASSGFKKSLSIVFKALLAETIVAVLILLGVYTLHIPEQYFYAISFGGAAVLIWLASKVWKIKSFDQELGEIFSLSKIVMITVLNGGFWIFWITICVPRAFELNKFIKGGHFLFLFIFELGWLVATVSLGYIFSKFRFILQKKNLISATFKFFAILLVVFAIKTVYSSMFFFLKQ